MDERFAREVRLNLAEHLDPVRGEHAAWASSPAAAAVASPARHQAGPGRYWLLVAAAIAAVTLATTILLAGGFRLPDLPTPPWLLSESPTPTMPDASPGPTPTGDPNVFSWGRDDLGDWVTDGELTDAIAAMALRGIFPAPLDDGVTAEIDDGGWVVSFRLVGDTETWRLGIHNGDHGGRYVGPPAEIDPRLPDGVTYEAEDGFGYGGYIVSGPGSDELLALHLWPPGVDWSDLDVNEVGYKARVFALASMVLVEMGWAGEPAADPNVFSWARDDLGEWVTEGELTDAIAAMAIRGTFPAPLDGDVVSECGVRSNETTGLEEPECVWSFRLAGDEESWRILVHSGDHDGNGVMDGGGKTVLRDGVRLTYAQGEDWLPSFAFSGPRSEQSICLTLLPPGLGTLGVDANEVGYKARVFGLAPMTLRELGWAD